MRWAAGGREFIVALARPASSHGVLAAYRTMAPGHSVEGPRRVIGGRAPVNVAYRTNVICCMSVRLSVVAAEALALLSSCSLWPSAAGSSFEIVNEQRGAHDASNSRPLRGRRHEMDRRAQPRGRRSRRPGSAGVRGVQEPRELAGEAPRIVVAWLKDDQSGEDRQRQCDRACERRPAPEPSARKPRSANALPRVHRSGSIQSTRRGLAARVGKR